MTADDVIGSCLIAKSVTNIRETPSLNGKIVGTITPGQIVGPIYSWVERDGYVWWMFDYTIPGNTPGAYYVAHRSTAFKLTNCVTSQNLVPQSEERSVVDTIINFIKDSFWTVVAVIVLIQILKKYGNK